MIPIFLVEMSLPDPPALVPSSLLITAFTMDDGLTARASKRYHEKKLRRAGYNFSIADDAWMPPK